MKKLLIMILATIGLLSACGGAGASKGTDTTSAVPTGKLELKTGGKNLTLTENSGAVYLSEMVSTAPGKPNVKTSLHTIYVANFEMDTSGAGWMRKPLTAPEQMRVSLELIGEDGTDKNSPLKVGTYAAQADKTKGVRVAKVLTFADGKQTETSFNSLMGNGDKKATGEVKITSVTAESVSGEVDLTEGDKAIKGVFTAKIPPAK